MKHLSRLFVLLLWSALAIACAAPSATPESSAVIADAGAATAPAQTQTQTPPMSKPYPPRELKPAVEIDYACKSSADCAVKNVGSCCGAQPACVNKDSPVDAAAVQAQCQARGMVGVCGFQEIAACQCVSGRCEPDAAAERMSLPAQ